jgi:hypothetical protein
MSEKQEPKVSILFIFPNTSFEELKKIADDAKSKDFIMLSDSIKVLYRKSEWTFLE